MFLGEICSIFFFIERYEGIHILEVVEGSKGLGICSFANASEVNLAF